MHLFQYFSCHYFQFNKINKMKKKNQVILNNVPAAVCSHWKLILYTEYNVTKCMTH